MNAAGLLILTTLVGGCAAGGDGDLGKTPTLNSEYYFATGNTCEKYYSAYRLSTVEDYDHCVSSIVNVTTVEFISSTILPHGCAYYSHPLFPEGMVAFFNNESSKAECSPTVAVCICNKHERRGVVVGSNFLLLLAAVFGIALIVAVVIWFRCVRLSAYERERRQQLKNMLVEQVGLGGFASTMALRLFGDGCINLRFRFGETEGDFLEQKKRVEKKGPLGLRVGKEDRSVFFQDGWVEGKVPLSEQQGGDGSYSSPLPAASPDYNNDDVEENDNSYRMLNSLRQGNDDNIPLVAGNSRVPLDV